MSRRLFEEHHDPWRLGPQGQPEPVEGPLQPAMVLLEDEDALATGHPLWLRLGAAAMALGFLLGTVATAFATGGGFSPLTDAGNWKLFAAESGR